MKSALSAELKRLVAAFGHAGEGFRAACDQPALRLELLICALLVPYALLFGVDAIRSALLIGSLLLVLIVELLNSAIETVVDRISIEWHALSKRAKDIGSAAVLLSIINAGIIWCLILF